MSVSTITHTVIHCIGHRIPLKNTTIDLYSVSRHRDSSAVHRFEIRLSFKGVSLYYIISLSHKVITFITIISVCKLICYLQ